MAPRLPDRYETQVRLGRDGDIEEWLATDTALDRPVLVRMLDDEASQVRRSAFISGVRAAARSHHAHLTEVYAVGTQDDPYTIVEWHGGVSVADRLAAGDPFPVTEFLPNAAGLADGLAALHDSGAVHGSIDPSSIGFAAAHPAKLIGFGRHSPAGSSDRDTRDLATALRIAVTGNDVPGIRPSQVAEGLPAAVDGILASGELGEVDAHQLAAGLRAIPFQPVERPVGIWSWRWLVVIGFLLLAALLVAVAGRAIDVDPDSPFLFPAAPAPTAPAPTTTPPTVPPTVGDPAEGGRLAVTIAVYDPSGDGTERDSEAPNAIDEDPSTGWRTERYFSPLPALKDGVGLTFTVGGRPSQIDIVATPDTRFEIRWAEELPSISTGWQTIASGTTLDGVNVIQLPDRGGGVWLLWLTALPELAESEFRSTVFEVAFRSP
ncbi:MAG: protein kinase [Acidimicrobiia bacterium]|nr:protein kinase [Acidimicrobiia bacterium]